MVSLGLIFLMFRRVDSNCNGISGVNRVSGITWEEELCGGTGAKGIIYIGKGNQGHHIHW